MMTHTPGPWKQIEYDDWLYIGGDDMDYVEYDPTNEPYNYHVINAVCVIDHVGNITEREDANARLIAAAPDLLAACNKAANEFERLTGDNGFEPERFRERISIMHELNRAISEAGRR